MSSTKTVVSGTTISLKGMSFFAYHGCTAQERQLGCVYVVDVAIKVNEVYNDELSDTVDYSKIYLLVKKKMNSTKHLLETLAREIGEAILIQFNTVEKVTVEVAKKNPPVEGLCAQAQVTLCVERKK